MIQRIQTIYLLVSVIFLGLLFALPLANIYADDQMYEYTLWGIFKEESRVFNGVSLAICLGLIVLLHLFVMFSYKRRIRQIRILVFTMVLMLGFTGVLVYFGLASFEGETAGFKLQVAFPVVAVVTDFLAVRAIGKDETLIRSLNRIR